MSSISQFGGGGIKSIQRDVISITPGNTTATATIAAVDTSKTELRMLGGSGYDVSALFAIVPRIVLTNSTTITATASIAPSTTIGVSWELTEYY